MSEVQNAGSKGYCLMWGIIGFLLFVILVIYVYYKNFQFVS
jgi:F0F1-type ATP synthase membrane subunit b/b'